MIIGLTGSFAAGKGSVVGYLVGKKGFAHFSARTFITEEIIKRDLPINRDTMINVANDLRREHSPTYIIEMLYKRAETSGGNAVIESIRELAGVHFIKEHGGVVIGIDADPSIRYKRARSRASKTDHVSFEKWHAQEQKESNQDDPTKQNIFGSLRASDYVIINNGTLEELHAQIEDVLKKLEKE